MSDLLTTAIGTLGTGGIVTIIMWVLQSGSRRAEKEQADRAQDAAEFKSVTDAWERLNGPLQERVTALSREVEELRAHHVEDRRKISRLERELADREELLAASLSLNEAFRSWADAGAEPPPPTTYSPALRTRLNL